jgi:hypothetical protein
MTQGSLFFFSKHNLKKIFLTFLIFKILISINSFLIAQENSKNAKPVVNALKITRSISLTGKLDNPEWEKTEPIEINYEFNPGDNIPATQKTIVKILYDNENIYFGFECFDKNPEQIRANITDRDKIFNDDFMIIVIDTYNDYHRGYEFAVNPYGIQADLLNVGNNEDSNIDWIWSSAAVRNEHGWTAEISIPFSSLNFPEKEEQTWGLGIVRTLPRSSRTQISWAPIDRNIPGFLTQLGILKGLKNIKSGKSIEFLPYAMGQQVGNLSDLENPASGFKYDRLQSRFGFGIKYSPSPSFSIDAVLNPDFSQIESDADQISVNTTFALQYEEKRPFFLIGRELLQTPMYYSRSINDPLGAGRILGKSGSLSYMYMGAYDRNTVFDIPGEEGSNTVGTNLKSFVNIGRLRYEIGNETYVGIMLLTRDLYGGHNYVTGLDWNYKFWTNWNFSGEGFLSQTKELNDTTVLNSSRIFTNTNYNAAFNGEKYSGDGIHLSLSHSDRSYNFGFIYETFSPTYQTYDGSFSQNGYKEFNMSQEYVFYPQNSLINKGYLGFSSDLMYDFNERKKDQYIEPYLQLGLKSQTNIFVSYLIVSDERFNGIYFKNINRIHTDISTQPMNEISLSLCAKIGKFIYRTETPELGTGHNIIASVTLKPTSQLNLTFSYSRARLTSIETRKLCYDGNIFRANSIYQFNQQIFFRIILQYNTFDKTFQVYPLFNYKLNAFTTFYAGATTNYMDYRFSDGLTNTSQQYFVKFQYLIGL